MERSFYERYIGKKKVARIKGCMPITAGKLGTIHSKIHSTLKSCQLRTFFFSHTNKFCDTEKNYSDYYEMSR